MHATGSRGCRPSKPTARHSGARLRVLAVTRAAHGTWKKRARRRRTPSARSSRFRSHTGGQVIGSFPCRCGSCRAHFPAGPRRLVRRPGSARATLRPQRLDRRERAVQQAIYVGEGTQRSRGRSAIRRGRALRVSACLSEDSAPPSEDLGAGRAARTRPQGLGGAGPGGIRVQTRGFTGANERPRSEDALHADDNDPPNPVP